MASVALDHVDKVFSFARGTGIPKKFVYYIIINKGDTMMAADILNFSI